MSDLASRAATLLSERVRTVTRLAGGDLSEVLAVTLGSGRGVVAKSGPAARTEAAMLAAIAAAGVPAPAVLAADDRTLVLERIPAGGRLGPAAWADLGAVVARLHRTTGPGYGWPADHAFGPVAIPNAAAPDWPAFWAERRLLAWPAPLPAPLRTRLDRLAADLGGRLPRAPVPSLLHGDLWTGNVLVHGDRVTGLIDPACAHGHGEVDLAMLCLFADPPAAFWEAHGAPDAGWPERRAIYQLWPALVHLRLFGTGYLGLVSRCLDAAGA